MIPETTTRREAGADLPPGMFTEALRREARRRPANLRVETFRDPASGASTQLVYDENSRIGVVVDPVAAGDAGDRLAPCADLVDAIERLSIDLQFALETRSGSRARSASAWLARRFGSIVVRVGSDAPSDVLDGVPTGAEAPFAPAGQDEIVAGPLRIEVLSTGTGTCYRISGAVFPSTESPARGGLKLLTRRVEATGDIRADPAAAA